MPPPPSGLRGAAAALGSCSRPDLALQPPAAPGSHRTRSTQPVKPVVLIPLGNLSKLIVSPGTTQVTHYKHSITCVHMTHCTLYSYTLTLVYTHAGKTFTQQQAYETITFTHLDSSAYTVTLTCTHSCTPRQTSQVHALRRALQVHKHASLGTCGLAPFGMLGQTGRTRRSHPGEGHRLWP